MENVGITGGCGLIGSHVVKKFLHRGYNVEVLDDMSAYPFDQTEYFGLKYLTNLKITEGSICNKELVNKFVEDKKYIIHMASLADVGACIRDPETNFNTDVIGSFNLLRASKKANVKKFIFSSSASVYGNPKRRMGEPPQVKENNVLGPTTPYANTKLFFETELKLATELYDFPTTSLRYFSVYGIPQIPKKDSFSWMIPIFTMKLLKNKPITIFWDGTQIRDMVEVRDIAEATVRSCFEPKTNGQIINIGNEIPTTINKIKDMIFECAGKEVPFEYKPGTKGDPMGCYSDASLMKKLLNWKPEIKLEEGIKEYVEWATKNQHLIPDFI